MESALSINDFGTYKQLPDFLVDIKLSPTALKLFSILLSFKINKGEAYVCRNVLKEKLNVARDTISRAVTELQKKGLIKRTGKYKHATYPIVELFFRPKGGLTKTPEHSDQRVVVPRPKDQTQLKRTIKIKKQTKESDVCFKNSVKTPEENKNTQITQSALTSLGVSKNQAKKLIQKYSSQAVMLQIQHLKYVQNKGGQIKNPAGWLTKALSQNYTPPKGLKEEAEAKKAQEKRDRHYKAQALLKKAESQYQKEAYKDAKSTLKQSLEAHPSEAAKKLLERVIMQINRNNLLSQAKDQISKSQQETILQEAKIAERQNLKKSGLARAIPETSKLFIGAVQTAFEEKLLAHFQQLSA